MRLRTFPAPRDVLYFPLHMAIHGIVNGARAAVRLRTSSPWLSKTHGLEARAPLVCLFLLLAAGCRTTTPFPSASPHEGRVRVGPFAEFGRNADGVTVTAVRPFYSEKRLDNGDAVTDYLAPLGFSLREGEARRGRVLNVSWHRSGTNETQQVASYGFWFAPFYTQGRTLEGKDYWALIPIYGEMPRFMMVEDVKFALFPLYTTYRNTFVKRSFVLWPFFGWIDEERREDEEKRHNFFPFYGTSRKGDWRTEYVMWPFWNSSRSVPSILEGERLREPWEQGSRWMLFPVWGQTRTNRESQDMFLPPFFAWGSRTNVLGKTTRVRAPWPFLQYEEGPLVSKRDVWPLYGTHESRSFAGTSESRSAYLLWPIAGMESTKSANTQMRSRWVAPIYYEQFRELDGAKENALYSARLTDEQLIRAVESGVRASRAEYRRVWPLFTYREADGAFAFETLALWPQQYGGGMTRCWAPFWTLYARHGRKDGAVDNDVLWGMARWGRGAEGQTYFSLFGLARRYRFEDGATRWSFF